MIYFFVRSSILGSSLMCLVANVDMYSLDDEDMPNAQGKNKDMNTDLCRVISWLMEKMEGWEITLLDLDLLLTFSICRSLTLHMCTLTLTLLLSLLLLKRH